MIDYFSNIPSQTVCAVILDISYDFPGIADTTLTKKKFFKNYSLRKDSIQRHRRVLLVQCLTVRYIPRKMNLLEFLGLGCLKTYKGCLGLKLTIVHNFNCRFQAENILVHNHRLQSIVFYPNCRYADHMCSSSFYSFVSQFCQKKDRVYQTEFIVLYFPSIRKNIF